jgi:23S rRNA (guanine745-N1)-methyltransferase
MFPLRCTVRRCDQLLRPNETGMACSAGHHFDRAKQGYWNLLQPQDRKSKNPGDSEDAVLARHRWLKRGHAAGLIETLRPWVAKLSSEQLGRTPRTLDLGCGEGTFGPALFGPAQFGSDSDLGGESSGYCGIDLSKRAIKLASRHWKEATWVLANADRVLPAADRSVDRVVSLFGRRPIGEIQRVLATGGVCIVAVPGEDDLIELREHAQESAQRRSRWEAIVDDFSADSLDLVEHKTWKIRVKLEPDAIADAMAMTYRAVRRSQRDRLETLAATEVTLAADLMLFRHASG